MSLFDFLLWAFMGVISFRMVFLKRDLEKMVGWLMFGVIVLLLQLIYEGYKWQSILLYIMPVLWILYYKLKHQIGFRVVLVTCFVLSSSLLVLFPTPILDEPTGPYVVGTTMFSIKDQYRTEDNGQLREIPVQIWYPSYSSQGKDLVKWFVDGLGTIRLFSESNNMLPFMLDQLDHVRSHSYKNIDIASNEFPIVIISHGWMSSRILHLNFAELLASNGYIVIGIDHTYGATMTKLEDDTLIAVNEDLLDYDNILELADELVLMYKEDIECVIDRISLINKKHPILKDHMMEDKIALLGHSTGGGACVMYAQEYDVTAVVLLDPWVEPFEITEPLTEPALFLRSEAWSDTPNNIHLSQLTNSVREIKGSTHQDFTLAHKVSPLLELVGYTSNDNKGLQEDYILKYFDHYIKERTFDIELLDQKYKKEIIIKTTYPQDASN